MEDKLKLIYLSGNYDLCFELMKGVDIDYLDLNIKLFIFGEISSKHFNNSTNIEMGIYDVDFSNNVNATKIGSDETFEVTFWDRTEVMDTTSPEKKDDFDLYKLLEINDLNHLTKYIGPDENHITSLLYLPRVEVLKLIFKELKYY